MAPSTGASGAVQLSTMLKSAAIMNMAYLRYCTAKDMTAPKVINDPTAINAPSKDPQVPQNSCLDDDGTACKADPQCLNGLDPGGHPRACLNATTPEMLHDQNRYPPGLRKNGNVASDQAAIDKGEVPRSGSASVPNNAPPINGGGTSSSSSASVEKKGTRVMEMLSMNALRKKMCSEVCGDVLQCSAEQQNQSEQAPVVSVPLTKDNLAALWLLGVLSFMGCIYIYKIFTQQSCKCKLCKGGYELVESLGSGGYGEVYVVSKSPDKQLFVAKKIRVRNITEAEDYSQEAKDLVGLRHKHIVSYEEDFVHTELPFRYSGGSLTRGASGLESTIYYFIVMEYCEHGDLKQKIEYEYDVLCEKQVLKWFFQTCQAVQYLHSKKVIHRDIKSQNVFLTASQDVRLGDFGLCRHMPKTQGSSNISYTHAGTDCYMAPEMLSSTRYGMPADVWSLGAVLYEMCSGQFMWELENGTILGAAVMQDRKFATQLIDNNIPHEKNMISPEIRALMKKMLSYEPNRRPTVTEMIRKKVFKRGFNACTLKFGECNAGSEKSSSDDSDASSNSGKSEDEEVEKDESENEKEAPHDTEKTPDGDPGLISRSADKLIGWLFTSTADEDTTGTSTGPTQEDKSQLVESDSEEEQAESDPPEDGEGDHDLSEKEEEDQIGNDSDSQNEASPSARPKGKAKKKKGMAKRAVKRFKKTPTNK